MPSKRTAPVILSLAEHPQLHAAAAAWFSSLWGVPVDAYRESMAAAAAPPAATSGVPAWFVVPDQNGGFAAGIGIIANDFHRRPDLTPNLCALYVRPESRGRGLARTLLDHAVAHLRAHGVADAYLITDHTAFYEKCGWTFFGTIEENDGNMIRMYHRSTAPHD